MFLTRGSGPILFNKLERSGVVLDWDAYPRDLAHLARFAEQTLERHVNWQIVNLAAPVESLHDAPVLYVTGADDWDWDAQVARKLRAYLDQGGLIFAVASAPGGEFEASFRRLADELCPDAPLRQLGPEHPVFTQRVHTALEDPPTMLEAHNGIRPLLLFCRRPINRLWHGNAIEDHPELFALGTNVYLYATDRAVRQSRLTTHILPDVGRPAGKTIRLARIRYDGLWGPEPFGWEQLRRDLAADGTANLRTAVGVRFDEPRLTTFAIAHVTGTNRFTLTDDEVDGLRRFIEGGGTLLADAAGGREEFDATFRARLKEVFPNAQWRAVPLDHPIWRGPSGGEDLRRARTRRTTSPASTGAPVGRRGGPRLEALTVGGRMAVIYCPIDLSAGLVGQPIFDCPGVRPPEARKLMRNLVLFANENP
jgi:hypothetical protein